MNLSPQTSRRTFLTLRSRLLSLPVLRFGLGALTPSVVSAPTSYELYAKVLKFENPWNVFIRDLYGCPREGETSPETCKSSQGNINYKAWSKARRAAKELFELKDKAQ